MPNVKPGSPLADLPFTLDERSSRVSALLRLMLIIPALIGVFVPLGLVAAQAADVAAVAQARPLAAAQITLASLVCMALFGWPAFGLIRRFGSRRTVHVDATLVAVAEVGPFIRRGHTQPLKDFAGICHVVRTSLSGVRHELMLVDRRRHRHVVFHTSDQISADTVMVAARGLGLPEIAARDVVRFPTLSG